MWTMIKDLWRTDTANLVIAFTVSLGLLTACCGVLLGIYTFAVGEIWHSVALLIVSVLLLSASLFAIEAVEKSHR